MILTVRQKNFVTISDLFRHLPGISNIFILQNKFIKSYTLHQMDTTRKLDCLEKCISVHMFSKK